jgi:hypothetical protein
MRCMGRCNSKAARLAIRVEDLIIAKRLAEQQEKAQCDFKLNWSSVGVPSFICAVKSRSHTEFAHALLIGRLRPSFTLPLFCVDKRWKSNTRRLLAAAQSAEPVMCNATMHRLSTSVNARLFCTTSYQP